MPAMETYPRALGSRKGRVSKINGQWDHSSIKEKLVITIAYNAKEGRAMVILR